MIVGLGKCEGMGRGRQKALSGEGPKGPDFLLAEDFDLMRKESDAFLHF
jgi:hypothetical protein